MYGGRELPGVLWEGGGGDDLSGMAGVIQN
jgi:hypothetical protein